MEHATTVRGLAGQTGERLADWWRADARARGAAVVLVIVGLLLALGMAAQRAAPAAVPAAARQHVEGIFADVNGDGLTDFIVDAEVILNRGPLAPRP